MLRFLVFASGLADEGGDAQPLGRYDFKISGQLAKPNKVTKFGHQHPENT